jgi:hypothetical protein
MTASTGAARERRSIGDHGLTVSDEDPELVQIVLEAAPQLSLVGNRLSSIIGYGARGVFADGQIASMMELLGSTVSAMYAAIDTKCDLDPTSPPSDVDERPRGPNHTWIRRCHHNPPHCWDRGTFVPCP